ncbi:MAG: GNAT family N-acetyltransferase [Anaerolineae bacterium]
MAILEASPRILDVPDAPAIPGLVFRRFWDESDLPSIVTITNACRAADHIEAVETPARVANVFQPSGNFDPHCDAFIVEVSGEAVAYGRLWWRREDNGTYVYPHVGGVHPAWRGRGIGRALLRLKERRMREIASAHPDDAPRFFQAFIADSETDYEALARGEGYAPARYFFEMVRPTLGDIADAPLPEGLEMRPVQPEHYRTIWEAKQEAFRDHWGAFAATEWHFQNWLNDPNFDPTLWQVAWDGDQVAGMVLGFVDAVENEQFQRQRGWTEDIAVRRPWRKRGLARALIVQTLHALKERGMTEAALGVDAENLSGALGLYKSAGFRVVKRSAAYRKPLT